MEHGNHITSLAVTFVLFQLWPRFSTNSLTIPVNIFTVRRLYATCPHGTFRVLSRELSAVLRVSALRLKNNMVGLRFAGPTLQVHKMASRETGTESR